MKVDSSLLDTAAAKLLLQLKDSGVDYVLANSGTDFPPLIEVFSLASEKHRLPTPLAIFHESVAIGMAHGYYLASGKMAAVIVHVNVGLANCTMGLINAAKSQIPLLLMSGRTPATETSRLGSRVTPIHWGQEMYDQSSMVRESVKWEYELRFPEQAETAIARASAIAQSPPYGPVYLSLPREVLAEPVTLSLPVPVTASATLGLPQIDQLEKAAEMLAFAKDPIIVLQRSVPQGNLPELVKFAEDYSIPVVEFWTTANVMPTTHEMHAGFDPGPIVAESDLVVCLGTSVPWAPIALVKANTKVIAMGVNPNGKNINHNCGSTYPKKISLAVKKFKAHLGISLDGDADRIIMSDELGNIIDGDQIIAAISKRWKDKKMLKGGVVGTLMSNYGLEKFFRSKNIKFLRSNVGDRYVKEKMQKNNFNLGGEQSGHIILGKFATTGDGLLVALETLFAIRKGRKASSFFNKVKKIPQVLKNIEVKNKSIIKNSEVKRTIKQAEKLMKDQGRILVRESGTESKIRVMGESEDKKLLNMCVNMILKKIK